MPVHHRLAISPAPSSSDVAPAFYRLRDVVRIAALSRSTVYRRIAEGRFPAPIHLGGRASAWPSNDLQEWINSPDTYQAVRQPAPTP